MKKIILAVVCILLLTASQLCAATSAYKTSEMDDLLDEVTAGIASSAGAADAGKIINLDTSGLIDSTFLTDVIGASEMADEDHGFFTYSSGVASLDTGGLTSANLLGALTNETGTGVAVFGTAPTLTGFSASSTIDISPSGAHTSDVIDFSSVTINHTGSNGPVLLRAGTYASPISNSDEDQSGLIRFYTTTDAGGSSYDRGAFFCNKTTNTKGVFPVAGLAEVNAVPSGVGPNKVQAGQFISNLNSATAKLATMDGDTTAGMYGTWNKVASSVGSVAASGSRVAPLWVDNQMNGTVSGEEYGIFATTGGSVPDAFIGFETTSSGWAQFLHFDDTAYDQNPVSTNSLKVLLNATQYYIPMSTSTAASAEVQYLEGATGTTGTTTTNIVFSTSPTITTPTISGALTISAGALTNDTVNDDDMNWADINYLTTNGAAINEAIIGSGWAGWDGDPGPGEKDDIRDWGVLFDADGDGSLIDETWYLAITANQEVQDDVHFSFGNDNDAGIAWDSAAVRLEIRAGGTPNTPLFWFDLANLSFNVASTASPKNGLYSSNITGTRAQQYVGGFGASPTSAADAPTAVVSDIFLYYMDTTEHAALAVDGSGKTFTVHSDLVVVANGGTKVLTPLTGDADLFDNNFTGAYLYGGTYICNGPGTVLLPVMAAGMNFTVITLGDIAVVIDTNGADGYLGDGTTGVEGAQFTNTSTAGDMAVIQYYTADDWLITTDGWTPG